jgi:hypothetical protein
MPGKMARSDPRPSVRVTRGAGSGQHLSSVLQEGRENANIDAVWDSSGESRFGCVKYLTHWYGATALVLRHAGCAGVGQKWDCNIDRDALTGYVRRWGCV